MERFQARNEKNQPGGYAGVGDDGLIPADLYVAGGGGVSFPIDDAPLHGTYGDDFAGTSLDAKWTRRNIVSGDETFHDDDWLSVALSTGNQQQQYHQAAPAGDFTIVLSLSMFSPTLSMTGPMIIDSGGSGVSFSPYYDGNAYMWGVSTYAYGSSQASIANQPWAITGGGGRNWLALNKTGTAYKGRYSVDGTNWSRWTATYAWAGTVDRIGFGRIYGNYANHVLNADRFNVV